MKNNERENDVFDELLRDALASDAAPSEDFTARLMEQVRRTPQEKPLRKQPVIKLLAAVAALGTGVLGGLAAYPIAKLLMGLEPAGFTVYMLPFFISTAAGRVLAFVLLKILEKSRVLHEREA